MSELIGIILLAAGGSSRLGRPKQLLAYRGRSLLRSAAEVACEVGCGLPVVVLGRDHDGLLAEVGDLARVVVRNDRWQEGMGTSISAGVAALDEVMPEAAGALLMTCDQPGITAESLRRLTVGWATGGRLIAAASYRQTLGIPAVFAKSYFPALRGLRAAGAKSLIEGRIGDLVAVSLPEAAEDVDTPEDYDRLTRRDG